MVLTATDRMTVREFLERGDFEEGFLYELINGTIVKRASPNTEHQRITKRVFKKLDQFVEENALGECVFAPYDVVFDEEELVLPDLIFVANKNSDIIKRGCIEGTPDLLVEVLSPGTSRNDRGQKMKLYRRFGVAEYWIVDPKAQAIEVWSLQNGDYDLLFFAAETGEIESIVLPGLKMEVSQVFE